MMPARRVCSAILAGAVAIAALAGCSSGPPRRYVPTVYAVNVTTAGRVRWQVPLALPGLASFRPSPLAAGAIAIFAQRGVLYGLRTADGHQVWSRDIGEETAANQDVAGMWLWHGLVIVLTDGSGGPTLLAGLDASTGQVRWRRLIAAGVTESYRTGDGGLAMLRADDEIEVVDLSTGEVRWRRPAGYAPDASQNGGQPMAVTGGTVLFTVNGKLTGYDDRTGQVRWTDELMPIQLAASQGVPGLQAAAGLVYVTGVLEQGAAQQPTQVLLGISAATGRVQWRFVPSRPATLWNYAPGLVSVTFGSGDTWQDGLDPASGRVRWQVASTYHAIATPDGIVIAPGPDGRDLLSVYDTLTGQIRWTARFAGLTPAWRQQAPALTVYPAGPLLVVPAAGLAGRDQLTAFRLSDGRRAWQVTLPEPVAAPPSAVPGGMLVFSADLQLPP